jgi:hypothetical protein
VLSRSLSVGCLAGRMSTSSSPNSTLTTLSISQECSPGSPSNPTVNFHGERRSNATHTSTTDPEARLARKGYEHEAKLSYQGHVLMENRHGLVVDAGLTRGTRGDPARGPEHDPLPECDRRADGAAWWLRGEPAEAEVGRGDLRLGQDDRAAPKDTPSGRAPGRLDIHLRAGGLQPGADPEPDMAAGDRVTRTEPPEGRPSARLRGVTEPATPCQRASATRRSMLDTRISAACQCPESEIRGARENGRFREHPESGPGRRTRS